MSGFIPLSVPNFGVREAELAGQAITSGWVSTSGGKVTEFEEALAAYVGMPRAVACNAGTSALHLAAMAAGITRGDEVIVPSNTFIATVLAVADLHRRRQPADPLCGGRADFYWLRRQPVH